MKKSYPLPLHGLMIFSKSLSFLITLILLLLLLIAINSNSQCPPGVQCDFLTKKGTLTSASGAEIFAFDPVNKTDRSEVMKLAKQ